MTATSGSLSSCSISRSLLSLTGADSGAGDAAGEAAGGRAASSIAASRRSTS